MAKLHFTQNGFAAFLTAVSTLLNENVPSTDDEKRSDQLSKLLHQYIEQSSYVDGNRLPDDDLKCLYSFRDAFQVVLENPDFFFSPRAPH